VCVWLMLLACLRSTDAFPLRIFDRFPRFAGEIEQPIRKFTEALGPDGKVLAVVPTFYAIVHSTHSDRFTLGLSADLEIAQNILHYELVIVSVEKDRHGIPMYEETNTRHYQNFKHEPYQPDVAMKVNQPYITALYNAGSLPREFTVGDGMHYGGYWNRELAPSSSYIMLVRAAYSDPTGEGYLYVNSDYIASEDAPNHPLIITTTDTVLRHIIATVAVPLPIILCVLGTALACLYIYQRFRVSHGHSEESEGLLEAECLPSFVPAPVSDISLAENGSSISSLPPPPASPPPPPASLPPPPASSPPPPTIVVNHASSELPPPPIRPIKSKRRASKDQGPYRHQRTHQGPDTPRSRTKTAATMDPPLTTMDHPLTTMDPPPPPPTTMDPPPTTKDTPVLTRKSLTAATGPAGTPPSLVPRKNPLPVTVRRPSLPGRRVRPPTRPSTRGSSKVSNDSTASPSSPMQSALVMSSSSLVTPPTPPPPPPPMNRRSSSSLVSNASAVVRDVPVVEIARSVSTVAALSEWSSHSGWTADEAELGITEYKLTPSQQSEQY